MQVENKKRLVAKMIWSIVISYLIALAMMMGLAFLLMWEPWLKKPTIDFYMNDLNYHKISGYISYIDKRGLISFEWVRTESGDIINENDFFKFSARKKTHIIHSKNLNDVYLELNSETGMEIVFTYGDIFYKTDIAPPIVQIEKDGQEILSFEEGKEAFIDYLESLW